MIAIGAVVGGLIGGGLEIYDCFGSNGFWDRSMGSM